MYKRQIYGGTEDKCEAGVALILDRQRSQALLGYNVISERILTVRLSAHPFNLTLIQVYAPTNQASEEVKSSFYVTLQDVLNSVPKQDIVLCNGDFNAKIGGGGTDRQVRTRRTE